MRNRILLFITLVCCLALAITLSAEDPTQTPSPQKTLSASVGPDCLARPMVVLKPSAARSYQHRLSAGAIPTSLRTDLVGAPSRARLLAHLYTIEAGIGQPIDRAIMVHILDDRRAALSQHLGRPVGLIEAADRYSAGILRRSPDRWVGRQRWILALDETTAKPDAFPNAWDWPAYRAGFLDVLEEAEKHVAGDRPPDPCDGLAGYWGGRGRLATTTDAPRGTMRPIVCHPDQVLRTYSTARTRQRYLYRPS